MNFSFWFSKKLKLNAGGSGANATGIAIAIAGVALALIIMECTIAIVGGFKQQITDKIMGFEGQISVLPAFDYSTSQSDLTLEASDTLINFITREMPNAKVVMKFNQPGILKTPNDFAGVYFIGYGSNYDYTFEQANLIEGKLPDFQDSDKEICLSSALSEKLGLTIGDKVDACFFVDNAIKSRRYEVAGIYNTGFSDYDDTIIFAPIASLQRVANADSLACTSLSLYGIHQDDIEPDAESLQLKLIDKYRSGEWSELYPVDNVKHTGALYFNWLNLLDTNVVVIFILMSCVAAFTLISSIFILILDHIPTIGLLKALGASNAKIRNIFNFLAMKIVGWGVLIGNIIGIGLLLIQYKWKVLSLNPEMYYLPSVPIALDWWWIILLNICLIFLAWCLLIIPSRSSAKINPSETLNFE